MLAARMQGQLDRLAGHRRVLPGVQGRRAVGGRSKRPARPRGGPAERLRGPSDARAPGRWRAHGASPSAAAGCPGRRASRRTYAAAAVTPRQARPSMSPAASPSPVWSRGCPCRCGCERCWCIRPKGPASPRVTSSQPCSLTAGATTARMGGERCVIGCSLFDFANSPASCSTLGGPAGIGSIPWVSGPRRAMAGPAGT